jgi:hypothetical protein
MPTESESVDLAIVRRIDNAISICDTSFAMHPGFLEFAGRYYRRPLQSFLLVPSGVVDDLIDYEYNKSGHGQEVAAGLFFVRVLIKVLEKRDYAQVNYGFHCEDQSMTINHQVLSLAESLRSNHRVCVLSNNFRILESIHRIRQDRRKGVRGISCVRFSDQTNQPVVGIWREPGKPVRKPQS